ncbi:MAG: toxin-antitoxin system TumE family protein [Acidiferrobacterales bacterium]
MDTNLRSGLIYRNRKTLADGAIMEMVIWKLPEPDLERPHGYKYRRYYGKTGKRLVSDDHERGKGDHKDIGDREERYRFVSVDQLVADFLTDIKRAESEACEK